MDNPFATQISFIAAIINVSLAVVVLLNNPRRHLNQAYAIMALSLFGWNFGEVLWAVSPWDDAILLSHAALTFVPVTAYHFVLAFVGRYRRRGWMLLKVSYGVAAGIAVLIYLFPVVVEFWHPLFCYLAFPPLFYMALYRLSQRMRRSLSPLEKAEIAYIFGGFILALAFGSTSLLHSLGLASQSLANLGSMLFASLLAVVIIKFSFLDLGLVVGRGLLLLLLASVIFLFFYSTGFWIEDTSFALFFNVLIATLFLIVIFEPLRRMMEDLADRFLQRESYAFQERLARLSKDIISIVDLDELFAHTCEVLERSGRAKRAIIFLQDAEQKAFRQASPRNTDIRRIMIEAERALVAHLQESPRILVREELQRDLGQMWLSPERRKRYLSIQRTLNWQGVEVCVPFMFRGKLSGFLLLALADGQPILNRRERDMLLALGGQLAISLENARIFRRMSDKDRLAALGEMAAGLAHEIRNPLGAIKGAAQFIQGSDIPEQDREFLGIILQETERLNQVLGRFLVFARSEHRQTEPCLLPPLIERMAALIRTRQDQGEISVTLEIDEDLPEVLVDGDELQQVFLNLLLNACEAMPKGGEIVIEAHLDNEPAPEPDETGAPMVVVTIRDEGVGISADNMKKIFTPFFTTRDRGTGLGLAISQRIIQDMGGTIEVESTPEVGSAFALYLPTCPVEEPAEALEEPVEPSRPRG